MPFRAGIHSPKKKEIIMFNTNIFTLNKIGHDSVEVVAEENVFAYAVINGNNSVTVKFPGGITHDTFKTNIAALDEIARIWSLIADAERSTLLVLTRSGVIPVFSYQEAVR